MNELIIFFTAVGMIAYVHALSKRKPKPTYESIAANFGDYFSVQVVKHTAEDERYEQEFGEDNDEDEESEDDYIENPAFAAWAAEQTQRVMKLPAHERALFIRTGKLPPGFTYSRRSPPCLLDIS